MTVSAGELWIADITFTSGTNSKKRPVLVLWVDGNDVVVAAVTSAAPRSPTDVPLQDWTTSGLRLPSTVRLARLDCLEQSLLLHHLGRLSSTDAAQLKAVWNQFVHPQF